MIIDFLKTTCSKEDLKTTLEVLRKFKACESNEEWAMITFTAWAKLQQFEEFLEHLVEGKELAEDTIKYIAKNS
ncbi:MAG: hypothetical protein JRJ86_22855 [Deltaproteobacteria bacterium]|nr:hypothetical protein [Deltaproteobacteria bacterium]